MKKLFCILFVLASLRSFSQTPVAGLTLIQNKPLYFSYLAAEDFLVPHTIQNAFEVRLSPSTYNLNAYAQVIFTSNEGKNSFNEMLSLKNTFRSSSNVVMAGNEVSLTYYPVLLFSQPRTLTPGAQPFTFMYDLIMKPFTNFVKPNSYNYSIVITVTPE